MHTKYPLPHFSSAAGSSQQTAQRVTITLGKHGFQADDGSERVGVGVPLGEFDGLCRPDDARGRVPWTRNDVRTQHHLR